MSIDLRLLSAEHEVTRMGFLCESPSVIKQQDESTRKSIIDVIRGLSHNVSAQQDCGFIAAFTLALLGKWTGRNIPIQTIELSGDIKCFNTGVDVLLYST